MNKITQIMTMLEKYTEDILVPVDVSDDKIREIYALKIMELFKGGK